MPAGSKRASTTPGRLRQDCSGRAQRAHGTSEQRIKKKPIRSGVQVVGLLTALVALLVGAALPDRAEAQASRAGWWVRVDTKKTEASGIGFQLGAGKNERRDWRIWRTGEPPEFDLPGDLAQRPQIYLHATANPDDEDVWFCVFFKSAGVRRFDFDTTEGTLLKQTDRDGECR